MVYTGVVATEEEIAIMSGELIDETGNTEENRNLLMKQAESFLCLLVKYDIVTNWATINNVYKKIFSEWASRFCACSLIAFNMSTVGNVFQTLIEPEDMIQFHIYRMEKIEEILTKSDVKDFLKV